ncbi:N-acetyltransferase [Cuneatibacter caecimuris]|uniref:Acetyltransferase (GNAT) family protein n=1 Tax=Cuneatibacter caecimuris TaxID=1796618 RepID=A0A4Q7PPE9_9FIRM|nr:N-acetyltransferase [Cuneatibacter caecimuris]RZT02889.1 hypothetical protein EV209_1019 [Cuneatibacter caecimuris]
MAEFIQIKLEDMISELGENVAKSILSTFSSPNNADVQDFIRNKAIEFSKQALSKTTLIYWMSEDEKEKYLVGYYTLANKFLNVCQDSISKTMSKRLFRHGTYDTSKRIHTIPAILIGQLSKNFADGNNLLISGSDILQMALNRIQIIQKEIGGKFVFLECENEPKLIKFYEDNGFVRCGERQRDRDELGVNGNFLQQMIMYLH